jgi:hypothetical protein
MDDIGTTSIASGQQALSKLLEDIDRDRLDWNEAETRFNIIDRIITECLGWPRRNVRLEQPQDRKYSDYELGSPRCCIWEAKRENRTFELPANPSEKLILDLPSMLALGGEAADAVKQVQEYCSRRGVELAVATNGHQLIAFLASRSDGIAPLKGHCLVVGSYSHGKSNFHVFGSYYPPLA